ncbi:hypothetical protein Dimus_039444 [Dionaea muscipula]
MYVLLNLTMKSLRGSSGRCLMLNRLGAARGSVHELANCPTKASLIWENCEIDYGAKKAYHCREAPLNVAGKARHMLASSTQNNITLFKIRQFKTHRERHIMNLQGEW